MSPELDNLLCKRYPKIFPAFTGASDSLQAWGFECGDGWFDLIDGLCQKIQTHIDSTGARQVIASQVKEKYGEMRFYYSGSDPTIDTMIEEAESRSESTCEYCGKPGQIVESQRGWLRVRCAHHAGELSIQRQQSASTRH